MADPNKIQLTDLVRPLAISAAVVFVYFTVLSKLVGDWWTDENYSHGLLVPFVIGFVVWNERDGLRELVSEGGRWLGGAAVAFGFFVLLGGTIGAELFTQRVSLLIVLAGVVVYFFGRNILSLLALPFALLILAIPIPQIIFNRIAFPLQIWASQIAVWCIRLFEVPTVRKGNVIDILPSGSTQAISLEVVEACSGIRSLMTLVTLSLILAYLTRGNGKAYISGFGRMDLIRALILMAAAVPIAVITNAGRVAATGILTFYYGKRAMDAAWHDLSGWIVYAFALALLVLLNYALRRLLTDRDGTDPVASEIRKVSGSRAPILPIFAAMIIGGIAVNWYVNRGEKAIQRIPLAELSRTLGDWNQKGEAIRFDPGIESVLGVTDYTMREYSLPDGRIANLYVGYYASQRTGATYHSPQNCLPGAGWQLSEPQTIEIVMANGRTFTANRYVIKNGIYNEVMIYWYAGRGRTEASEVADKLNTVFDSITRRRTDGAMVRVMTSVGSDEAEAVAAAVDISAKLAENLSSFVPN